MVNKNEIEDEMNKSLLSALRIKEINVANQIRNIKIKYSHFINIGKINMNILIYFI